jgi:lysophospholipase L1-like esterase
MKKVIYISLIGLGFISSCKKTAFDAVERTSGTADFKTYISVGNSLTQGYQDGGLYEDGQSMSYPSIIAQQMKRTQPNMGEFRQPMTSGNGSGYMHLAYINGELKPITANDNTVPGSYLEDVSWSSWGTSEKTQKYNNLGIAGVKLIQCVNFDHLDDNTTNGIILGGLDVSVLGQSIQQEGNPYARFLDFGEAEVNVPILGNIGGTPKEYLDHVKQSNATFFTCWLGNNDVLGYVVNGGTPNVISNNTIGLSVDLNALSDEFEFEAKYDSIIKAFSNQGAKGVCATLPNVTSIPFVTTFTVEKLKADYNFNKVWITDYNENVREATSEDYVLLHASSSIAQGKGQSQGSPFTNYDVLDKEEVSRAKAHTAKLNASIYKIAGSYGFPVADMFTYMDNLSAGFTFDGIDMNISYIQGGTFSLDGIHPNPRGYAVVANEFIRVINAAYDSNIPKVSIGNYRGVKFP